jgi:hypothetical protein
MKEETLARIKAEAMSPEQLAREIARIDHGIKVAASPRVLPSYRRRREIYAAELNRQIGKGGFA